MIRNFSITVGVAFLTFLALVVLAPRDVSPQPETQPLANNAAEVDGPRITQKGQPGLAELVSVEGKEAFFPPLDMELLWSGAEGFSEAARDLSGAALGHVQSRVAERQNRERVAQLIEVARGSVSLSLSQTEPFAYPPSFESLRGDLPAPVVGDVLYTFGDRSLPSSPTTVTHSGLTYSVESGTPVQTVGRGIIRFAGELYGHGNVVIVEHDSRFHSVYVYLQRVSVEENQFVQVGDVLGNTGASTPYDGTRLYFEIRHGERALDPADWLSRRRSR